MPPGRRLRHALAKELRELIPAWLFFLGALSLLRLTRIAILQAAHIQTIPPSQVLIGSLLIAKGVLSVDLIPFLKKLDHAPVLIGTLWKTLCYALLVFCFQYLEWLFELRHQGLSEASRAFVHRFSIMAFWVIQLWLVILLFTYSAARQLLARLGSQRFKALWLERWK
jgi:hypothetical protein